MAAHYPVRAPRARVAASTARLGRGALRLTPTFLSFPPRAQDVPTATLQVLSLPEAEMEAMSGQARAAAERFTGDMFERQLGSLVHEAKPKQRACYSANASAPTRFG